MLHRAEITCQILQLTNQQWSSYLTDSWKWMGNCTLDEGRIYDYLSLSTLGLTILTKSIFRAQHARSYYLSQSIKQDILDYKNEFRNEVYEIIRRENLQTQSMAELERTVVKKVKRWVKRYRPNIIQDEVWRVFAKHRLQAMNTFENLMERESTLSMTKLISGQMAALG